MRILVSTRNAWPLARLSPERVWLRETRGKMERFSVESCVGGYHVYKARTLLVLAYLNERYWPRFFVVLLPCSLLCSLRKFLHQHTWDSLRKGTYGLRALSTGHKQRKRAIRKRRPVQCGRKFRGWKIS